MNLTVKFVCSLEARSEPQLIALCPVAQTEVLSFRIDVIARVCAERITEWVQRNNAVCLFRARATKRLC